MMCQAQLIFDENKFQQSMGNYRAPRVSEFPIPDRYLAMSVIQKAIRRNEPGLALSAGEYLRTNYPRHFWQRLQIIALEDIGLANSELVAMVLNSSSQPHGWGVHLGPEKVGGFLVERLCESAKCRATDDLYDVLSRDPVCAINCTLMADDSENARASGNDAFTRALSLIPPTQRDGVFPDSLRKPDEWVLQMEQADFSTPVQTLQVASLGAKHTRSILAPMLVALAPEFPNKFEVEDETLLPVLWHRGLPTWACGQHTRVGLAGLREFARRSKVSREILLAGRTGEVSAAKVLGGLLFRIECGQLQLRAQWSLATDLKLKATNLGWGLRDNYVHDLLAAMKSEWDLLNECRLAALQNYFR